MSTDQTHGSTIIVAADHINQGDKLKSSLEAKGFRAGQSASGVTTLVKGNVTVQLADSYEKASELIRKTEKVSAVFINTTSRSDDPATLVMADAAIAHNNRPAIYTLYLSHKTHDYIAQRLGEDQKGRLEHLMPEGQQLMLQRVTDKISAIADQQAQARPKAQAQAAAAFPKQS